MMAAITMNVIMGSVILLMLGAGLGIAFRQLIDFIKRLRLVGIGLLANFVIVPVLFYLGIRWIPLAPEVKIGIMLMAAAPVAPMAPSPFVEKAKGDVVYSVGLMAIVAMLSVVFTPLIISLSLPKGGDMVAVDPLQIVKTLLIVQLIPITVGMVIRQTRTAWADKLLKFIPRIGQIGLVIGLAMLLAKQASQMLSIGPLSYLIMFLLVIVSLLVGDSILIGEAGDKRRSLAVSTAIRNIPLAFLIANESFPGTAVAPVTLGLAVFTMVLSIVYGKLRARSEA